VKKIDFTALEEERKLLSKPLKDFIYERNKGRHVFFVATENEAIAKLTETNHK